MSTHLIRVVLIVALTAGQFLSCLAQELSLELMSATYRGHAGGYDVFETSSPAELVRLRVRRRGDNEVAFFVTFSERGARRELTRAGERLNYELLDSVQQRHRLRDLPHALPQEVLTGAFRENETVKEFEYVFLVPPLQKVAPGIYQDSVTVSLYSGVPGDHRFLQSANLQLSALVHQTADVVIVDTGQAFDSRGLARALEFGQLQRGKNLGVDLRVRSNTRYSLVFESLQGGLLRHVDPTMEATVPYELRVRGRPLNLPPRAPILIPTETPAFSQQGERYDLSVTVFPSEDAAAGNYRDVISITLISNE